MKELKDFFYIQMAYGLAEKAIGWASPNPYVGAVIVKNDTIIGHGYHERSGKPHAEVTALQRAGSQARNSTAYINLEPCVHWGKTPPCTESLLQARVRRVVISDFDPNPLVSKKGIKKLREAGIEVSLGLLQSKNRRLNETYIKFITKNIPFVVAKVALSLDGKMATKTFSSRWISSAETRKYVHLLRGEFDALMIGVNTLVKDDPLLTVRHPNWRGKRLKRIILDSQLRFPLGSRILSTLSQGRILVFTPKKAPPQKAEALRKKGVEVISLSSPRIDPHKVLSWLGQHGISSVLVEGGGRLLTSMLEEKAVDKIFVTLSPKLIGGEEAPTFLQGKGVEFIKDSVALKRTYSFQIDEDLIVEGYL
ncbi:MAG: bifunctional diaminohydroxyphosphoribosylaminopyrimidine deaminase/5-amino-6-(5-phosphoribosylamino)uracil reductase RibD [Candidatus Aminicenantes bacterium]|jgi:diaminohydroxyphosphoribosylaminopyrimidine deaminase/5-amino-6-(5-phosphoribosylamino)uracil reductase